MEPSRPIPQKILQMARSVDILLVGLDEATALTGARDQFQAFAALGQADMPQCLLIRTRRKDDGGRSEKLQDRRDPRGWDRP
jgi:hypothetical protein